MTKGRIALLVAAVVVIPIGMVYCGEDHQRYLAFKEQRDAWHRKCDVYVDQPVTSPAAKACAEELKALTAYAKQQGW